jgi:hypothetical protein
MAYCIPSMYAVNVLFHVMSYVTVPFYHELKRMDKYWFNLVRICDFYVNISSEVYVEYLYVKYDVYIFYGIRIWI